MLRHETRHQIDLEALLRRIVQVDLKSGLFTYDIEIGPVHHRLPDRIRAHAYIHRITFGTQRPVAGISVIAPEQAAVLANLKVRHPTMAASYVNL